MLLPSILYAHWVHPPYPTQMHTHTPSLRSELPPVLVLLDWNESQLKNFLEAFWGTIWQETFLGQFLSVDFKKYTCQVEKCILSLLNAKKQNGRQIINQIFGFP